MTRIQEKFTALEKENKKAFVSYLMASDPNLEFSLKLMHEFANNGVDIIELGMPFSEPMAEGPTIQKAAGRALDANCKIKDVIETAKKFRENNSHTPVILMGYFNPILNYGIEKFTIDCDNAGVDGFIIVDLPPEEENELTSHLNKSDMSLIKLTTPTTDENRAKIILNEAAGGFVYYVSVAGVTGVKEAVLDSVKSQISLLKSKTDLPICVGFGIKTPQQAKEMSEISDGIVIGSAFVNIIENNLNTPEIALAECAKLTAEVRSALDN